MAGGWFDPNAVNWFDESASQGGWFDETLQDASFGGGGGGGSYTAPTRRSSTTATGTGTNVGGTPGNYTAAITLNKPSGVADGDLLFTVISTDGNAVGLVQTLAGWTAYGFNPLRPTTDGQRIYVFWKIASGEGASWTWSTDTNNGNDWTGTVVAYYGQNATWNTDTAHSTVDSTSNSSPVSVADSGVTTSLDNTLLLYIGAGDPNTNNSGSWSDPSGYTAGSQSYANYAPLMFADKVQATAGASGSVAGTLAFAAGAAGFAAVVIPITGTASGGTTYDVSISESVTASDALAAALSAAASVTEGVTVTDLWANVGQLVAALSEASAATDTLTSIATLGAAVSEPVTASDSPSGGSFFADAVTEPATASDAKAGSLVALNALSEPVTVTDAPSSTATLNNAIAEAITPSDSYAADLSTPPTPGSGSSRWFRMHKGRA